jgi:hypothetical protein
VASALAGATASATKAIDLAAPLGRLSPPHPLYRLILFGLAGLCVAVAVLPPLFANRSLSWERRLYWSGFLAASVFVALGCLPNWQVSVCFAAFGMALATGTAYFNGPYIKIRGKVYAFYLQDSQAEQGPDLSAVSGSASPDYDPNPDSIGGLATARKGWWMNVFAFAFGVACLVVTVHASDRPWFVYVVVAAALVIMPLVIGYGDASWRYSVARGQRVQFAIIAVITLGLVTVVYLIGYSAGRRWPLRRTQSLEYRAHPRHWRSQGD